MGQKYTIRDSSAVDHGFDSLVPFLRYLIRNRKDILYFRVNLY